MGAAPLRIMIVEDEIFIALGLEMELKVAGYTVCAVVSTGEEAIAAAARESPDVILMDIRLAGEIDGIEAAQQIQAAKSTPVIFMTGYSDADVMTRAKGLQPLGYLIKPVRLHDLKPLFAAAFP